jgi:hypothetical protein
LSDPEAAVRARLTALQARLGQPTPPALEGQEEIPLDDTPEPQTVTQPPLW